MINPHLSFITLTFNEELNIRRLLDSVAPLNAQIYVLDSGSKDKTLDICQEYGANTRHHPFINHPRQWDAALKLFEISTPWVICLDADQIISPELLVRLQEFRNENHPDLDGIYFNRKYYFKGKWIRHGGYYPKFLLKMFRYPSGYSDLTENMDHRFQVPGKTVLWKTACIIEENLKENRISFWIDKHNRYSDLLADEELMRKAGMINGAVKARLWGMPNERNAWLKKIWIQLPVYLRSFLYFSYRMIFRLGILDGKTGITFHFLQAFWFRLVVDIKIDERNAMEGVHIKKLNPLRFLIAFPCLFFIFYLINITQIAITTPGGYYSAFIDMHLNYIACWRKFCISSAAWILKSLGYLVHSNAEGLTVKDHSGFKLVYSCLGYGVMSCFVAFVISFPKPLICRIKFLLIGLIGIQMLNTLRFALIAVFYDHKTRGVDHHALFNYSLYLILAISIYIWTNHDAPNHAKKEL